MSLSKYITVLAFVALMLTSFVFAGVSINNPVAGTTWKAGDTVTITWIITADPGPSKVTLVLRKGDPNALTDVATIASDVSVDVKSVTYKVPSNTVSGEDYTVGIGEPPNFAYSHQFAITGGVSAPASSAPISSSSTASSTTSTSSTSSSTTSATKTTSTVTPTSTVTVAKATNSKSASTPTGASTPSAPASVASRTNFGYTVLGLAALLPALFLF